MLDFPLELESPLFMNVRAMGDTMSQCKDANMPWAMCLQLLKSQFPEMNHLQFMEVKYEYTECFCVRNARPRNAVWDFTREESCSVRMLLKARNEPGFSTPEKFIQVMGRGMRMNTPSDLIGKPVSIKLGKITRKGDKNE